MSITFKSLKLKEQLKQMRRDMSGRVSARIRLPEDMNWWYFQEFGTASRGEAGGSSYEIPTHKKDGTPGKPIVHPGIPPRAMVRQVLDQIRAKFGDDMLTAIQEGRLSKDELREVLLNITMPYAVETIADSFETSLPGHRPGGKLKGRTAAEVYRESAQIEDTTE